MNKRDLKTGQKVTAYLVDHDGVRKIKGIVRGKGACKTLAYNYIYGNERFFLNARKAYLFWARESKHRIEFHKSRLIEAEENLRKATEKLKKKR